MKLAYWFKCLDKVLCIQLNLIYQFELKITRSFVSISLNKTRITIQIPHFTIKYLSWSKYLHLIDLMYNTYDIVEVWWERNQEAILEGIHVYILVLIKYTCIIWFKQFLTIYTSIELPYKIHIHPLTNKMMCFRLFLSFMKNFECDDDDPYKQS